MGRKGKGEGRRMGEQGKEDGRESGEKRWRRKDRGMKGKGVGQSLMAFYIS